MHRILSFNQMLEFKISDIQIQIIIIFGDKSNFFFLFNARIFPQTFKPYIYMYVFINFVTPN